MDITEIRSRLSEKIQTIQDIYLLEEIQKMVDQWQARKGLDWELEQVMPSIEQSLKEKAEGKLISHEEVMDFPPTVHR